MKLFSLDSPVMKSLSFIGDLIILNVLFLVCCIPLVTIGASATALYTISMRMAAKDDRGILKPFFRAFKENIKKATVIWLTFLLIGAVLALGITMIYLNQSAFSNLITVEIKTDTETHSVAGTLLNGLGARIVKVEGFVVDVKPVGNYLYIKNQDKPGSIGRVATKLAESNINIATMQVGRDEIGGSAIMMLGIDNITELASLQDVAQLENIDEVRAIQL